MIVYGTASSRHILDGQSRREPGIDMALALIAKLDGEQVAENASVIMEYSRLKDPAKDEFAYLCAKA